MPKKNAKGNKRKASTKKKAEVILPNSEQFLAVVKDVFSMKCWSCVVKGHGEKKVHCSNSVKLKIGDKILVYISHNDTKEKFILLYSYNQFDLNKYFNDDDWNFNEGNNELDVELDDNNQDDLEFNIDDL